MGDRKERGGLRGALSRWVSSEADADAEELRHDAQDAGCVPVADVPDRGWARVRGTLQTLTLQPRAGTPALEADLFDGSGTVTLVWLGRRRITGVACGGRLVATGRISTLDGRRVMFNPRYELLPAGAE
ncbi:MAG TPA: OB-fold nucleic acid binding domain-containing protein [Jiangellaceae bacterium]|nr:OB-fold nucleic acid binding domain-containing protein [Jiangellaceae bacterium]